MTTLRFIRYAAWLGVGVATFLSAAIAIGWWRVDGPGRADLGGGVEIKGMPQIGGPFTLVDHKGRTVTERDFLGKPMLVFFGFTHCPEVCPTTLFEITNRLASLGSEAERLQVLFITADPERDTPEQLALYLQSFDPRIVGLSGTRAQVDRAIAAFKVMTKTTPTEGGGYNVDHTASTFMMDSNGRFSGLIDYHENEAMALQKMRRLAAMR
jgi:protein SCO1